MTRRLTPQKQEPNKRAEFENLVGQIKQIGAVTVRVHKIMLQRLLYSGLSLMFSSFVVN